MTKLFLNCHEDWLSITKINFNLSSKEGLLSDITTTHMLDKNNATKKSDRLILNTFYKGLNYRQQ